MTRASLLFALAAIASSALLAGQAPAPLTWTAQLAWRQHDGGHEDRSNMTHFVEWATRLMSHRH